jgi:PTH1 family peptidyl-tRNA hydrolase
MKPSFILVGLGNPGKQYAETRHNAGWLALDYVAKELKAGEYHDAQKFLCTAAEGECGGVPVLLVKPTTYMNLSGNCIKKLVDFYKLNPAKQLLVLCDDIDIPLGTHRFRMTGGPGTHNGLKSIVEVFGEHFPRLRIGLGRQPEGADLAAWVLSHMTGEERKLLQPAFASTAESSRSVLAQQTA